MAIPIVPLKPSGNLDIMNAIREEMGDAYQARVPEATKANQDQAIQSLLDHKQSFNEFTDTLVNLVGLIMVRNTVWTTPMAEFKQNLLTFGSTIEEVKVGLLRAHSYNADREYLEKDIFGTEKVRVEANFHTINRQEFYKITVNTQMLKRAFYDPTGLNSFISALMSAPATSDAWDEFIQTCELFRKYEAQDGFYKINVPDVKALTSGTADAKLALRKLRALARNLTFMSSKYNAAKMPTHANSDDLLIFVTPEFEAAMDVEALAAAFNINSAVARGRIIAIPEEQFGIPGAQAIVTTKDFFIIGDTLFETTQAENPVALHRNFFLHHHSIISASRFVPAVLLTTDAGDEDLITPTPVVDVTPITAQNRDGDDVTTVERGEFYALDAAGITSPADGVNDGVRFELTGATSPRTYVTPEGVLHVSGREGSSTLTIVAVSTWLNPENLDAPRERSAPLTLTVTGEATPEWVNAPDIEEPVTP